MQNHGLVNVTAGPCPDHWPIELWLPKWGTVDLGKRLRKPKNIAVHGVDYRDFARDTVETQWGPEGPTWEQWSQTAETWLRRTFKSTKAEGGPLNLVPRTLSVPRDENGLGCTREFREEAIWIRRARRAMGLENKVRNQQEEREFQGLCRRLGGHTPAMDEVDGRAEKLRNQATERKTTRLKNWRGWLDLAWKKAPRKVYGWIKGGCGGGEGWPTSHGRE